jgi:hypothetical protein
MRPRDKGEVMCESEFSEYVFQVVFTIFFLDSLLKNSDLEFDLLDFTGNSCVLDKLLCYETVFHFVQD